MLIRIADELDTSVNILLGETIEPDENLKENAELKVIAAKLEILNEQFTKRSEKQRKVWMTVFIIIGAIAIITVLYELVDFIHYQAAMDAIYANKSAIGGYDGPTNIYVSNVAFKAFTLIIAMTAAVISAIGIHKTNRK